MIIYSKERIGYTETRYIMLLNYFNILSIFCIFGICCQNHIQT